MTTQTTHNSTPKFYQLPLIQRKQVISNFVNYQFRLIQEKDADNALEILSQVASNAFEYSWIDQKRFQNDERINKGYTMGIMHDVFSQDLSTDKKLKIHILENTTHPLRQSDNPELKFKLTITSKSDPFKPRTMDLIQDQTGKIWMVLVGDNKMQFTKEETKVLFESLLDRASQ